MRRLGLRRGAPALISRPCASPPTAAATVRSAARAAGGLMVDGLDRIGLGRLGLGFLFFRQPLLERLDALGEIAHQLRRSCRARRTAEGRRPAPESSAKCSVNPCAHPPHRRDCTARLVSRLCSKLGSGAGQKQGLRTSLPLPRGSHGAAPVRMPARSVGTRQDTTGFARRSTARMSGAGVRPLSSLAVRRLAAMNPAITPRRCAPAAAKAEIEIAGFSGSSSSRKRRIVRRQRHREAGRQPAVEQAGALELVEPRQIADRVEPEMRQERLAGAVGQRPAGRLAPAARAGSSRSRSSTSTEPFEVDDAADLLDLGARHRLVIGDDGERLDRRARELARLDRFPCSSSQARSLAVRNVHLPPMRTRLTPRVRVLLLQAAASAACTSTPCGSARRQRSSRRAARPTRTASPPSSRSSSGARARTAVAPAHVVCWHHHFQPRHCCGPPLFTCRRPGAATPAAGSATSVSAG